MVFAGPNEVSCSDKRAIAVVLGTNGWRKGPSECLWNNPWSSSVHNAFRQVWNARHTPGREPFLVGLQDPAIHNERRRTWTRGFSTAAVKGYEAAIEYRVNQLASELEKYALSVDGSMLCDGESVDLVNWLSRFS